MIKGVVCKSTGSWYRVLLSNGEQWNCRLKGKFKLTHQESTNPIAVGDRVWVEPEGQNGNGLIVKIEERENYLIRKSVHKTGQAHILAANLDQVIVIASLKLPRTSLGFIDRILVSAESFQIPAIVVINKTDLLDNDELAYARDLASMYTSIGYAGLTTSVPQKKGLEDLRKLLQGKVSLLCGHSGVGKSSLLNTISPELNLKTQGISEFALKGKHTTTYAEMFALGNETYIIDTPGIKELGLLEMEGENLSIYFPEMRPFLSKCKYYNCSHQHEPDCAVLEAVENGQLPLTRFQSYLSLMEDDDNRR